MRFLAPLLFLAAPLLSTVSAQAHEFWLSPEQYEVAPGAPLVADIRVGQNFKGVAYSYLPNNIVRFDLVQGDAVLPVKSRMGDRPAMTMPAPGEGLVVLVHETTDSTLTYKEFDIFKRFVEHKAFPGVLEQHAARGLPQNMFSESYRRFVKSLVAVGNGEGADRRMGLETEIVALANPYTDALPGGLPVQVFFQGAPRNDAQLEVFDKLNGETVAVTRLRTDDQGRVTVPVAPGHEYLLDAVVLLDTGNDDAAKGPVWRSLWASLTFRMPDE